MAIKSSPPFPPDVLAMVRRVARLSDIYWHPDCFPKEFDSARHDWLAALTQFVAGYSFERAGAPPIYRTYARAALEKTGRGRVRPTMRFGRAAWNEFERLARANGHGTNSNVCALYPGVGTHRVTAVEFIIGLRAHGHNLFAWASHMLRQRGAEQAVAELETIRGIKTKIATFYLRDVVRAAGVDEVAAGPGRCFQPIDVWVRRAASVWGALSGRPPQDDPDAADLIVQLAAAAGVGGGDLNGGVWILGSQLLDRNADPNLSRTLASPAALEDVLDASRRWSKAIIAGIDRPSTGTS